jgi:hypothetical protein
MKISTKNNLDLEIDFIGTQKPIPKEDIEILDEYFKQVRLKRENASKLTTKRKVA